MTKARRFLTLAYGFLLAQNAAAAGIDYSAPYCARPKVHAACTPEGSMSVAPKSLPKGGWPTRSIPFVYGDVGTGEFGGDRLKNAIRTVLKNIQSNSSLTFYECSDVTALRTYISTVIGKDGAKPAYMRFSKVNGPECINDSMGYPVTSTWLDVERGGPRTEVIGVSEVKLGGSQCSVLDPMGIAHETLHGLGFYHNLESPKIKSYFKLTGTPDPKYLKVKQLQPVSVAGVAFAKTELDYFSLLAANLEVSDSTSADAVFAPDDKFKNFAAQMKKKYGLDIYFRLEASGGPFPSAVKHDDYFGQSACLSQGDVDKLEVIYGPSSGLKCDSFNISSVPSCKPLQ